MTRPRRLRLPAVRALGVLACAALAACTTSVLDGADERSASEAVTVLGRAGLWADKAPDETASAGGGAAAFTVRVGRGDGTRALELLRAAGLPRERRHGFAETYGTPSLIPTPSEERARYLHALAGEIERTLESVDGVVGARVHLVPDEPEAPDLEPAAQAAARPRGAARAAVLLKTRPGPPPLAEADVRKLVAGSVPGLEPSAIAVVTTAAAASADAAVAWAAVGPLRVTPGSRGPLMAAIAVGLAVLAALAAMLLVTARRLAALERASAAQAAPAAAPQRKV
jgi:type III secretion protein J